MPSSTEPGSARAWAYFERWNRKLHFYVGLFLLFFVWLFAFSGLILNHPSWRFTEFWSTRTQTAYERTIAVPGPDVQGDLAQAREIMRQLGIVGEILWTTTRTDPSQFEFQVRRPGHYFFIKADFDRKRGAVQQSDVNAWGVIRTLHTFTGVQMDDPRNQRDWFLTSVWAYSMDAIAAGMLFMVLSSLFMWLKLPDRRVPGAVALGLGTLLCAVFCFGLRWFF
ncbi:MAG TPA: hypothetical protein VKY92_14810 [Verrucomicrobiae bacterium]|nr:hypothetical protein [Verrucomicrobiae bacterium]